MKRVVYMVELLCMVANHPWERKTKPTMLEALSHEASGNVHPRNKSLSEEITVCGCCHKVATELFGHAIIPALSPPHIGSW